MSEITNSERKNISGSPGAGECYRNGLDILKKYFLELLLITIVVGVFWMLAGIARSASERDNFLSPIYGMFFLGYTILIMNPVRYGEKYAFLKGVRGEKPKVKDIFIFQKRYLDIVLAAVLSGTIVMVGFVFLIVPGIIFACKLAFVPFLVLDRKLDAIEAIKKSWKMTRGHSCTIFLIGLIAIPIVIIGFICLGVGLIISSMWISSAIAYLYYRVSKIEEIEEAPAEFMVDTE